MITIEEFKPHVGKTFHFRGTPFALLLDHISSDRKRLPKGVQRRPFTLIFRGPRIASHLPEGMYECEVEDGPTYSIYVIPIHTYEAEFQDYQAVFN